MLVAIVSQNPFKLVFVGCRTIIARYVAKRGIAQMCLSETKCQGGGIAPFWGSANLPEKLSCDSDSIAILRNMGPQRSQAPGQNREKIAEKLDLDPPPPQENRGKQPKISRRPGVGSFAAFLGSQHPSPNVKTLCNIEPQIWPEIITSRDAKVLVLKVRGRHVIR